jgi:hypothetical protein
VLVIVMAAVVPASSKSPVPGFGAMTLTEPLLLAPKEKDSTVMPGVRGVDGSGVPLMVRNALTAAFACEANPRLNPIAEAISELRKVFISVSLFNVPCASSEVTQQ